MAKNGVATRTGETDVDVDVEKTLEQDTKKSVYFRRKVDSKIKTGVVTDEVLLGVIKGDRFPVYPSFAALMGKDGNAVKVESDAKLKIISNHLPKAELYWSGSLAYVDHDP